MPITNYYVATDAMNSITAILDEDGNVLERLSYEAFGDMTCMLPDASPVEVSPTEVDVGFQGQIRDEVTGLYQMGFRFYNPSLGRWLSRDPIGLSGGINSDQFVLNRPTQCSDAIGLVSVEYDFPSPIDLPTVLNRKQPLTGVINDRSSTSYSDFTFDCQCKCIDSRKQRIVCSVSFRATVKLSVVQSEHHDIPLEYIYGHEQQHIRSEWFRWMKRLVQPLQAVKPEFYEDLKACKEAADSIRKAFSQVFESLEYMAKSAYAPDHKGQLDETPLSPIEGKGYPPLPGSPDLPR